MRDVARAVGGVVGHVDDERIGVGRPGEGQQEEQERPENGADAHGESFHPPRGASAAKCSSSPGPATTVSYNPSRFRHVWEM